MKSLQCCKIGRWGRVLLWSVLFSCNTTSQNQVQDDDFSVNSNEFNTEEAFDVSNSNAEFNSVGVSGVDVGGGQSGSSTSHGAPLDPALFVGSPSVQNITTQSILHPFARPTLTLGPSKLTWVGLDYNDENSVVKVEMVTKGAPQYDLFEHADLKGQPQLIVRFYHTVSSSKLLRDLDASEFYSPISYIRVKPNTTYVDVVLTMRERVKSRLFALDGNVLLTFGIPTYYFGNNTLGQTSVGKALPGGGYEKDVMPLVLYGSQLPRAGVRGLDGNVFRGVPTHAGAPLQSAAPLHAQSETTTNADTGTLPEVEEYDGEEGLETGEEAENQYYDDEYESQEGDYSNSEYSQEQSEQDEWDEGNDYGDSGDDWSEDEEQASAGSQKGTWFVWTHQIYGLGVGQDNFNEMFDNQIANDADFDNVDDNVDDNWNLENSSSNSNSTEAPVVVPEPAGIQPAMSGSEVGIANQALMGVEVQGQDSGIAVDSDFQGRPISMTFRGAMLREVLKALASENNRNFILADGIGSQRVHVSFQDVPWSDAMRAILETHALGYTELESGVIRIDTLAKLEEQKRNQITLRNVASASVKTKALVIRLSHAKAKDVAPTVKDLLPGAAFDPRVKVKVDDRTNSIIVEATPDELHKIKALISRIDLPTPQVKIATRVIEVQRDNRNFLGISWNGPLRQDAGRGLGFGNLVFPSNSTSRFAVDTKSAGASDGGVFNFDTQLGSLTGAFELDIQLAMAQQEKKIEVLQNNTVTVLSGQEAKIEAGQTDYFAVSGMTAGGVPTASMEAVSYNLIAQVTPQVTADGSVQLQIMVTSDSPNQSDRTSTASKSNRLLETTMLRRSGETAVIGGLYTTDIQETVNGVPFFSKIPILGLLFKSRGHIEKKREMIIMVTPTILPFDEAPASTATAQSQVATVGPGVDALEGDDYDEPATY